MPMPMVVNVPPPVNAGDIPTPVVPVGVERSQEVVEPPLHGEKVDSPKVHGENMGGDQLDAGVDTEDAMISLSLYTFTYTPTHRERDQGRQREAAVRWVSGHHRLYQPHPHQPKDLRLTPEVASLTRLSSLLHSVTDFVTKLERSKPGKTCQGRDFLRFYLKDISGEKITATVWEEALPFCNVNEMYAAEQPIIVALTSLRVATFYGKTTDLAFYLLSY
ncbi:hypothetical protein M8C21_005480 [Ambrosia artemisiifolia]|uniref:Uncharacterized protein n=1 Tax=Ambrosia artemisiifolia TaxID=4212 RepID=A0AAD5CM72_AMBAR|nr:hypothetical protein M8C21_005480 [Ambrosia artemisiifolia]